MSLKKSCLSIVIVLITLSFSMVSIAGAKGHHPPMPMDEFNGFNALMKLDLSSDQKKEVARIFNNHMQEGKALREKLFALREKARTALEENEFDENRIRQDFKQISPVLEDMAVLRAKIISELKPVLTPEQLETLKKKRTAFEHKMRDRMSSRESKIESWTESNLE